MSLTDETKKARRELLAKFADAIEPLGEMAACDMSCLSRAEAKCFHAAVELLAWLEETLAEELEQ